MSAVPPPYDRQASFTGYAPPEKPTFGQDIEAEFNAVDRSLDATQARLAEIQRDDGKLANLSVHPDALSDAVRALLAIDGDIRGIWIGGLVYNIGDVIQGPDGITYLAVTQHVANASFAVDLNAGLWLVIDSGKSLDEQLREDIVSGSIEGPLRADLASAAANKGAKLVAFIQNAVGAGARPTLDKLRETVSVKDFLCDDGQLVQGDGVHDDTTGIQRAIDHAETLTGGVGLDVFFPPGTYLYSALTVTTSDVYLRGHSTTAQLLKTTTTGNGITFGDQPGRNFSLGIEGLQFGQAYANAVSGAQVWFHNCGRITIKDCRTTQFPFKPATGFRLTNCIPVYLSNINASDNGSTGMLLQDCGDVSAVNMTCDANGGSGYEMNNVGGGYFANCTAFGNTGSAWFMTDGWPSPVVASRLSFLFFVNCIGDTSSSHNWSINNCVNSVWSGSWGSTQNPGAGPDLHGFAIGGTSQNLTFQGCTAMHCNGSGLIVGNTATDIRVIGGGFEENGQHAGSTNRHGVVHAGTGTVESICAKDTQTPGFKTQQYGLSVSPAGFMRVRDNHLEGNVLGGIFPMTNGYADFQASGNATGASDQAASATTCILPGLGELYEITGTTDIYGFTPAWKGRRVALRFASTARVIAGASMRLPTATITPGQYGTADFIHDGAAWLLLSYSVNDNT